MSMLKHYLCRLHWLAGLSAGLVLAVMGCTGGLYSFSEQLIKLLDPQVTTVQPLAGGILPPAQLLARISLQKKHLSSLSLSTAPDEAARAGFMTPVAGSEKKTFELQYLNPYTGELLGKPDSEAFFRSVLALHRNLALGDAGKAITGAATLGLVFLLLSGMYLRWPKTERLHWRTWLQAPLKAGSRSQLLRLHAVLGSWLILSYFLFALTGLSWSYQWARDGIHLLAGAGKVVPPNQKIIPVAKNTGQAEQKPNIEDVWRSFSASVPHYRKLIMLLPSGPAQPVQILYLTPQASHPYANNRIVFDALSGVVQEHERYADKTPGAKLLASLYALHSGSYFGVTGMLIMLLSALMLPVLLVTGWMMYLKRR